MKNKKIFIIIISLLGILCLCEGIIIGKILLSDSKESSEKSSKTVTDDSTSDTNEEAITIELSDAMKRFMVHIEDLGSNNMLEYADLRFLLTNLELESVKNETQEAERQNVAYVDYDVYKNKYEEIFGDNYVFDLSEDISGGSVHKPTNCDSFPSVANQNKLCWSLNLGVSAATFDFVIDKHTRNDNQLIVDGNYSKTGPDNSVKNGTFQIIYTINNNKPYLKSLIITKN